jgi:GSH-dependent disulfide-bond oxidoreductase
MLGQLGFFHTFAGKDIEDPRPKERYRAESERLLKVLSQALADKDWITGSYSIADIAIAPWLNTLKNFYKADGITGFDALPNLGAYLDRFLSRPAVKKGLVNPLRP